MACKGQKTLIVPLMDGELRERKSDTFFVEYFVNDSVHVVVHVPVVARLGPGPHGDVYAAGR